MIESLCMKKFNSPLAKEFILERYEYDPQTRQADFYYTLDNTTFKETLEFAFPKDLKIQSPAAEKEQKALFALHLALGVSYYKAGVPPKIIVKSGYLSPAQVAFWTESYEKGLGEFFYRNNIDYRGLINFKNTRKKPPLSEKSQKETAAAGNILCLGGGKDSLAAANMFSANGIDFIPLIFGNNDFARRQAEKMGKKPIIITRHLDPTLINLNQKGCYNGHVPFSLILAFSAAFASLFLPVKNIIVANERSANYGNTRFLGQEVNHQWSKSFEAEKKIAAFISGNAADKRYFSLLRPFWEVKIVEIFLKNKQFLSDFSSCNQNFRRSKDFHGNWCGRCPKCAFVFALFSAFLPRSELTSIFGKNLFTDSELKSIFRDLYQEEAVKPFECVGCEDEVISALQAALKLEKPQKNEIILQEFIKANKPPVSLKKLLSDRGEHSIPQEFLPLIEIQ